MQKHTNCYTFAPVSGTTKMWLEEGIQLKWRHTEYRLLIWEGHFGYNVRLRQSLWPSVDGVLHEADLIDADDTTLSHEASYDLVPRASDVEVTLLLVETTFGATSTTGWAVQPHFVKSLIYVGGDGAGLRIHAGPHQSQAKKQLFRLQKNESMLFFDANREVTRITGNTPGLRPVLQRATSEQVADYILNQAKERGSENVKTRAWCMKALQELGCRHHIEEFLKTFPTFRIKP
jgi:hypothetical protein